jgi:hypothetical protein
MTDEPQQKMSRTKATTDTTDLKHKINFVGLCDRRAISGSGR